MALIFNDIVSDCSKHTIINVSTSFEIYNERQFKNMGGRVIINIECSIPPFTNIYKDIRGEVLDTDAMVEQYKEIEEAAKMLDRIAIAIRDSKICRGNAAFTQNSNGEIKYTFKIYI